MSGGLELVLPAPLSGVLPTRSSVTETLNLPRPRAECTVPTQLLTALSALLWH